MCPRLRRCIECPNCHTRYLVGFSPYGNGSYLISHISEVSEDYRLLCSCGAAPLSIPWMWSELLTCAVSGEVYARGYGDADEVRLCKP